jgi:type II secretory pathway component PulJ
LIEHGGPASGSDGEDGFTLIEVLICTLVLTTGLLALAALLGVTANMQIGAREGARSMRLAHQTINEFMGQDFDSFSSIGIGGSLTDDVAFHYENEPDGLTGIVVRWVVTAGPVDDTRYITVRVINPRARQYQTTDLTTIIREW